MAALTMVGYAAPDIEEAEYWILQQRLLPHADRVTGDVHNVDLRISSVSAEIFVAFHNLGDLYTDQGKHSEAEQIYWRALNEKEKV